ncbi:MULTISPECIES: hypothetical protein [unclassified Shewanella]|uniref:hypothetical protein n=1 Tax=unclassified Shewanella TaxID=196818 RepID=UPI00354D96CE
MAKSHLLTSLSILCTLPASLLATADEKHHEDPTKIVTKAGVGYNDQFTFSGSIGLDATRMVNARINDDGSEWRIGGSWLFDFGIVNFNFNRNEYDNDASSNGYSVGTFIPLSYFGFTPGGWQIFPMAGYNYTYGDIAEEDVIDDNGFILVPKTSHGAYLGAFAMKPLGESWTLMAFGGGAVGSDSYSSYWAGGGASYKINQQQSFNFYGFISESDYGKTNKIGISYTYQFE